MQNNKMHKIETPQNVQNQNCGSERGEREFLTSPLLWISPTINLKTTNQKKLTMSNLRGENESIYLISSPVNLPDIYKTNKQKKRVQHKTEGRTDV